MERGVGSHEGVSARPFQVHLHPITRSRQLAVLGGLQLVDDLAADALRGPDDPRPAVGRAQDRSPVRRLAAASRVEGGRVQDNQRRPIGARHLEDARLDGPLVGVEVAALVDARRHRAGAAWRRRPCDGRVGSLAERSRAARIAYPPTVRVPTMFGWMVHTNW